MLASPGVFLSVEREHVIRVIPQRHRPREGLFSQLNELRLAVLGMSIRALIGAISSQAEQLQSGSSRSMSSESLPSCRRFELVGQRNMNLHRRAKTVFRLSHYFLLVLGGSMLGYHCSRRAAASCYRARSLEQLQDAKAPAGSSQRCLRIVPGYPSIALCRGQGTWLDVPPNRSTCDGSRRHEFTPAINDRNE